MNTAADAVRAENARVRAAFLIRKQSQIGVEEVAVSLPSAVELKVRRAIGAGSLGLGVIVGLVTGFLLWDRD